MRRVPFPARDSIWKWPPTVFKRSFVPSCPSRFPPKKPNISSTLKDIPWPCIFRKMPSDIFWMFTSTRLPFLWRSTLASDSWAIRESSRESTVSREMSIVSTSTPDDLLGVFWSQPASAIVVRTGITKNGMIEYTSWFKLWPDLILRHGV